jgi:hypothetical protein
MVGDMNEPVTKEREQLAAVQSAERGEPVAVVSGYYGGRCVILPINPARLFNAGTAFYTTPPAQTVAGQEPVESPDDWSDWKVIPPATQQKPWVDLTDEEIMAAPENLIACIAYVRNKLKEKNT